MKAKLVAVLVMGLFLFSTKCAWAAIGFTIANPGLSTDVDGVELITVDASISGTSTSYYLQGRIKALSGAYYFGQTKNNYGDFMTYTPSPDPTTITTNFYKTTSQNSIWTGQMVIKNDPDNPNYIGPGDYLLSIDRFTGSSNNAAGTSNVLPIHFNFAFPTPTSQLTPTNTPAPTSTPTPKPTATPRPTPSPTPTIAPRVTPAPQASQAGGQEEEKSETATVLGAMINVSPSPATKSFGIKQNIKGKDFSAPLILVALGFGLILTAVGWSIWSKRFAKISGYGEND